MFGFKVIAHVKPTLRLMPVTKDGVSMPIIIEGISLAKTYQEFISNLAIDMKCYKRYIIKKTWRII